MEKLLDLYKKNIPNNDLLEIWDKYNFIDSPFVELPSGIKMDGKLKIIVDMQYPKLGMKNAIDRCLIRKEALERLLLACTYIPCEYALKILDIYRPWELQNELYYAYKPKIIEQFHLDAMSFEKQDEVIKNYVSLPSKDENISPLHMTGGSIDLTITDLMTGEDLDLGVGFDDFSSITNTSSFELDSNNITARDNRRFLYNIMTKAGFTNLPSEIWHYDYGNRAWGYYTKQPALYKGIFCVDDIDLIMPFDEFINNLDNSSEIIIHNWVCVHTKIKK